MRMLSGVVGTVAIVLAGCAVAEIAHIGEWVGIVAVTFTVGVAMGSVGVLRVARS
jgi:hypothetical protein